MIQRGAGNDEIYNTESACNITLNGGANDDYIYNEDGSEVTIVGGTGNDFIDLGRYAQDNVIVYKSGDGFDVIDGFNETSTFSISGNSYSAAQSGDNVVVTVGKGSITLNGAATLSQLNILGTPVTLLTVNDKTKSPVTADLTIKTIDASARTKAIKITGNALDNTIKGGKGADTLSGGAGNDSLWGNAGADTFLYSYGDGRDVIFGFADDDLLQITDTFSASYNKSAKEIAFTVGTGSVTLKDFTATTFRVNDSTYQINGKGKFVKQ